MIAVMVFPPSTHQQLVLYLRIVHSYDFYTGNEYPIEDDLPHRSDWANTVSLPATLYMYFFMTPSYWERGGG